MTGEKYSSHFHLQLFSGGQLLELRITNRKRVTPTIEAGIADHMWTLEKISGRIPQLLKETV